jgi:hypothetical protein
MTMRLHPKFLVSAAVVLGLTGALRSSDVAVAVSGTCGLITQQEAATAFGSPVPAGAEKPMNFPVEGVLIKAQSCFYGSVVVVARYELGSGAQALFGKYRQEFASKSDSTDYQTVNGIGDEAFTAKGQLHIRKGQIGLLVGITLGDRQNVRIAAKALQAEKTLAALALGRM